MGQHLSLNVNTHLAGRGREVMPRGEPPQESFGSLRTSGAEHATADAGHEHLLRLSLGRAVQRGEVRERQRSPESGLVVCGDGDFRWLGSERRGRVFLKKL